MKLFFGYLEFWHLNEIEALTNFLLSQLVFEHAFESSQPKSLQDQISHLLLICYKFDLLLNPLLQEQVLWYSAKLSKSSQLLLSLKVLLQ